MFWGDNWHNLYTITHKITELLRAHTPHTCPCCCLATFVVHWVTACSYRRYGQLGFSLQTQLLPFTGWVHASMQKCTIWMVHCYYQERSVIFSCFSYYKLSLRMRIKFWAKVHGIWYWVWLIGVANRNARFVRFMDSTKHFEQKKKSFFCRFRQIVTPQTCTTGIFNCWIVLIITEYFKSRGVRVREAGTLMLQSHN